MAYSNRNRSRKKPSGSPLITLIILLLAIGVVVGYFWHTTSFYTDVISEKIDKKQNSPVVRHPPATNPDSSKPSEIPPISVAKEQSALPSPDNFDAVTVKPAREKKPVKLAIIIDDMGNNLKEARLLASIKVPLTFSIIPGLRADKEVAEYAASQKIETMIHIPMQSKGWPTRRLEANGLLVSMNADDLQERVTGFIQRFPGAVGVNNHMGSEFTEQDEKMTAVLQVLGKHKLFFVDSITTPESLGLTVAKRLGIRSARRNIFLDNEQNRSYILGQLDLAVKHAVNKGAAIAICHPHSATIAALSSVLPELSGKGVQLVYASQLVN